MNTNYNTIEFSDKIIRQKPKQKNCFNYLFIIAFANTNQYSVFHSPLMWMVLSERSNCIMLFSLSLKKLWKNWNLNLFCMAVLLKYFRLFANWIWIQSEFAACYLHETSAPGNQRHTDSINNGAHGLHFQPSYASFHPVCRGIILYCCYAIMG